MRKIYDEYEVLDLIDETADAIAEYHGMNVPYCESMDMSLFPQVVYAMLEDNDEDERPDLGDLRFLAKNNRILPDTLSGADLEEFKQYCKENKQEILSEIVSTCDEYLKEYGEDEEEWDEEEDEEDEDYE